MQSDSGTRTQSQKRLPVNPRRHRVAPENRKRVARACNNCNVRRVKCSGGQPCQQCIQSSRDCQYPPENNKILVSRTEFDRLQERCAALEERLRTGVTLSSPTVSVSKSDQTVEDNEATEGRLLYDPDGNVRFLGETSGATFLDYLKHFMTTLVPLTTLGPSIEDGSTFVSSIGQYQTYDSRPLPEIDVDPLWLPTRTEMTLMLAELRFFIQDGNLDFASGGIYYWGDLSGLPSPAQTTEPTIHRHLSFHHAALAMACQVASPTVPPTDQHTGEAYFQRAKDLLGNPLNITRFTLSDVSALALMGYYLIELNRRDAAYLYISLATHVSIMHGAHRYCVDEAGKRIFWTLFILDQWLSCLMGRPPTIVDEAVRLPFPVDTPSLPPAIGLRAHIELAKLSGHIVCNTYKIAPRGAWASEYSTNDVDVAMEKLRAWHTALPVALRINLDDFGTDLACCNLHMAYHQLVLLATRPVFFTAVKRAVAERFIQREEWRLEDHPLLRHIEACSEAAQRNMQLSQWVIGLHSSKRLLQAGLHFLFNATIVLLLKQFLQVDGPAPDAETAFAIRVFDEESKSGSNYAIDCCKVLQDLKVLVDRSISRAVQRPSATSTQTYLATVTTQGDNTSFSTIPTPMLQISEGDAVYHELMAWMQNDTSQLHTSFLI